MKTLQVTCECPKEKATEETIYRQMMDMLADQFYHQKGDNITINRMELADMLTKQTMHGMSLNNHS